MLKVANRSRIEKISTHTFAHNRLQTDIFT